MERIEASPALTGQPAVSPAGLPDPILSANVYNARRLDDLLLRGVADFWQRVRSQDPERLCKLWFVRYSRGGDHLKLRVHGPAEQAPFFREQLEDAVARYFASLPAPTEAEQQEKRGRSDVPPLDAEDRVGEDYPDRSLLFTSYQRSFISLGGSPLLQDDRYVGYLTSFLALAAEQALADLKLDADGKVPHSKRQGLLMKTIISSLATLDWSEAQRTDYLLNHRNWLLRFALVKSQDRRAKAAELLARYQQQISRMDAGPIARTLARVWDGPPAENPGQWPLRLLADYLEGFRGDPAYQLDPFTTEPAFTGVFKGIHGVANQLGLPMAEEAFTHHLLLHLRAPEKAATELTLMPE